MAFNYYGGKKRLAKYYDAPHHDTIIEPFAGGAGYSMHYATPETRVILIEKNAAVVRLWHALQTPKQRSLLHELMHQPVPPVGQLVHDPITAPDNNDDTVPIPFSSVLFKGEQHQRMLDGRSRSITTRVHESWHRNIEILIGRTKRIKQFEIIEGDYTTAPDIPATWFIDPPYLTSSTNRSGAIYASNHTGINYNDLAEWSQTRKGQVIVCEQDGANWLPFKPFREQRGNSPYTDGKRLEVVWMNTIGWGL